MWKWSVWILILILITYTIFQNADLSLITYVKERLIAFTNPKDDPTAFWRLAVWDASLKSFLKYPLFGQGFGGYWYLFVPELNSVINLPPHNLYIYTIVKIGLIGLVLYLIIILKLYKKFKAALLLFKERYNIDKPIVIFSIVVLVSAHFFYLVYSFDYFSMLYIGLGTASILNHKDIYADEL